LRDFKQRDLWKDYFWICCRTCRLVIRTENVEHGWKCWTRQPIIFDFLPSIFTLFFSVELLALLARWKVCTVSCVVHVHRSICKQNFGARFGLAVDELCKKLRDRTWKWTFIFYRFIHSSNATKIDKSRIDTSFIVVY